jgi:hypothetical protein
MRQRLVLFVIAATAMLTVGVAGARGAHFDSKVKIKDMNAVCKGSGCSQAKGKVTSEHGACEPNRTVKVYLKQPGPDDQVEKGKTDSEGKWDFTFDSGGAFFGSTFYAKVKRRVLGGGAVCKGDRSNDFVPTFP